MSLETRRLLNPYFVAAINASAAAGFVEEAEDGLPLLYTWVVPPLVLHKDTRASLPKVITTKMPSWAQQHAHLLAQLPDHILGLDQIIRHSLIVGSNSGILEVDEFRGVRPVVDTLPTKVASASKQSAEVADILKRAHFIGRWLSAAGNLPTVFSILGVGIQYAPR